MKITFDASLLRAGALRKQFSTWQVPTELIQEFDLQDGMKFYVEIMLGKLRFADWCSLTSGCEIYIKKSVADEIGAAAELYPHEQIKFVLSDGLSRHQLEFEEQVSNALRSDSKLRIERLKVASKYPTKKLVTAYVFNRNPDVVAEVLFRANAICESCGKPAPFNKRSNNSPYLEVHHKRSLADGGEDTINNAIALCPNCHRKAHFGPIVMQ